MATEDRLQASHDLRRRFETVAYVAGGGIIIAVCILVAIGIAMPPPVQCAPAAAACIAPPDWGAAIVSKALRAKDVLLDMVLALGGWTGVTLARGHMDARLPPQGGGQ